MPADKKKVGRPKKEFDRVGFEKLMSLRLNREHVQQILGISRTALDRCIAEEYDGSGYSNIKARFQGAMMVRVQDEIVNKALADGDTKCLLYLDQKYDNQTQKIEVNHTGDLSIDIKAQRAQLLKASETKEQREVLRKAAELLAGVEEVAPKKS